MSDPRPCLRHPAPRRLRTLKREGHLGRGHKIGRAACICGHVFKTRALGSQDGTGKGRRGKRGKGGTQGQIGQHLFPVGRVGDDDLGRRLAYPGGSGFALTDGDRPLRVAEADDPFQHRQRCPVAVHGQRKIGSPDRSRCRRGFHHQPLPAPRGAAPQRATLQFKHAVRRRTHLLDNNRGVTGQAHLRPVRKHHRKIARGIGPQYVACQQILCQFDSRPAGQVDELNLLAGPSCDHGSRWGCAARQGFRECRANQQTDHSQVPRQSHTHEPGS